VSQGGVEGPGQCEDWNDSWQHVGADGLSGDLTWEEFIAAHVLSPAFHPEGDPVPLVPDADVEPRLGAVGFLRRGRLLELDIEFYRQVFWVQYSKSWSVSSLAAASRAALRLS
jgi:hypothetical protein